MRGSQCSVEEYQFDQITVDGAVSHNRQVVSIDMMYRDKIENDVFDDNECLEGSTEI